MTSQSLPRFLSMSAAVVAAMIGASGASSPARAAEGPAQAGAEMQHGGGHTDMYFSTRNPIRLPIVNDNRFQKEPIPLSIKDDSRLGQRLLILQGDMIIARGEELAKAEINSLRTQAKRLLVELGEKPNVSEAENNLLKALAGLPEVKSTRITLEQAVNSEVETLLNRAVQLVRQGGRQGKLPDAFTKAVNDFTAKTGTPVHTPGPAGGPQAAVFIVGNQFRWDDGVIPFVVDQSIQGQLRENVYAAVNHWNKKTDRIYLRKFRQGDKVWVRFLLGDGCASEVGKVVPQGEQIITLGDGCLFDQVVHEIGHSVGLFHEQTRNDRETYLDIVQANIQSGTEFNFEIVGAKGMDFGPFDFASVMLYGPDAFGINFAQTMAVKDTYVTYIGSDWGINHRFARGLQGLSLGDVAGVKKMYELSGIPPVPANLLELEKPPAAGNTPAAGNPPAAGLPPAGNNPPIERRAIGAPAARPGAH